MVAEMLKKLRRSTTKDSLDGALSSSRTRNDSAAISTEGDVMETTSMECPIHNGTNFMDLPAELRNRVYELIICDTTLSIPGPTNSALSSLRKGKSKLLLFRRNSRQASSETPLNGLLLANRQLRQEYLSMLLSTASVVVEVKDFDFEHVARVSSALAYADMKALQSNRNLTLQLCTQNCTTKDLTALRRWLDFRKGNDTNLPWNYDFPLYRLLPGTTMGRVRLLRELEYYADTIAMLVVDLDAEQQCEIKQIIEAFERKAKELEDDLGWLGQRGKSVSRGVRGLAGGGIR